MKFKKAGEASFFKFHLYQIKVGGASRHRPLFGVIPKKLLKDY
jgi:hypothetical protein